MPRLAEVYPRSRLFRTLDAAVRKRVVLITAPAGAGKTSLVSTYLEARARPRLWYNIDARDGDIANLFHYIAIAAGLAARRRVISLPVFAAENQTGIAAFARGFFEALGEELPNRSVIVLDDYHEVRSDLFDDVLREAIAALPKGLSTIIMSRGQAPAWLARYRASGEVADIGWKDLRLTPTEIAGLVRVQRADLRGPCLRRVLPRIVELTSGWAAALTLLLQTPDIEHIDTSGVEKFSERLFDYFAAEILDKSTPNQREFLLKTSVVPSFTCELAARLSGNVEARRVLLDLERRSLLTQRMGASGAYRYHPLLRDFLRRHAEIDLGPTTLQELHRRAAQALVEVGQIDEAMEQLETSQDMTGQVRLLCDVAPSYISTGRGRTIERWIENLPHDLVSNDGWLLYWDALCCLAHAPTRAGELLDRAYAHFVGAGDAAGLYGSCAAAIQAIVLEAIDYRQCDRWVQRFADLRGNGPPCPIPLLPAEATGMLMASIFRGQADAAREWAARAMTLAAHSNDVAHRVITGGFLALRSTMQESLDEAENILEMLRESASATDSSALAALTLLAADSMFKWAAGDNAACIELVREAHAIAAKSGIFVWNDYLYGLGAGAALGSEDARATAEFLALARGAAKHGTTFAMGSYYFYASWDAFLRGNLARALHLGQLSMEKADFISFPLSQAISQFALAQIHWRLGNKEEARAALAFARNVGARAGYALVSQGCDLLQSDLEWNEDRDNAIACLRHGLAVAQNGGYHNMFWLGKTTMARIAARALKNGIEPEHVRTTIIRRQLGPPPEAADVDAWVWRYRIRALGTFEMIHDCPEVGGRSSPDKTRRQRLRGMPLRLFRAILAFGARGVRDAVLIDALWPDADGDAGRRVFDTTLHRLRRQLGDDDIVRLSDGRVSLDEQICWVDIWALKRALEEAEQELGELAPTSVRLSRARNLVAIYRGPLLADDSEYWVRGPRARLAASFRSVAMRLGQKLEQSGRHLQAQALFERALDDPASAEPITA